MEVNKMNYEEEKMFLVEELKKIDKQISELGYSEDNLETQQDLWVLRQDIKDNLKDFEI
jgi:hypothetical protein